MSQYVPKNNTPVMTAYPKLLWVLLLACLSPLAHARVVINEIMYHAPDDLDDLQYVEEGRLSLNDRVIRWFQEYPNATAITIDHLLSHTSGIYSFQNDPGMQERLGYHSPEELIEIARAHGNGFCPGEYWSYSNTGYVMLGRIIEQLEGKALSRSADSASDSTPGVETHQSARSPRGDDRSCKTAPLDIAGAGCRRFGPHHTLCGGRCGVDRSGHG